jgi:tetratricopeptide (TPR) repeat protein
MDERQELARLRAEVDGSAHPSFAALRDYLRQARELRLRDAERVTRCGAELLSRHARKLDSDELWEVHEQVAVAAMECGCKELGLQLVKNVHKRFPEGARGSRLTGVYFELMNSPAEARSLYEKELDKDPNNPLMLKRMVGLKRGQGDLAGAAELLKQYLSAQGSQDWQAWEEAADLYLQLQMYQQAAFCIEELLLHAPADAARCACHIDPCEHTVPLHTHLVLAWGRAVLRCLAIDWLDRRQQWLQPSRRSLTQLIAS